MQFRHCDLDTVTNSVSAVLFLCSYNIEIVKIIDSLMIQKNVFRLLIKPIADNTYYNTHIVEFLMLCTLNHQPSVILKSSKLIKLFDRKNDPDISACFHPIGHHLG